ncbi:hypothetical protein RsoM2USA_371 [Ralstonia phage RsoM2USA]|nr:hypothetical protein RsoM2USA_371 [Ralstonia phage RsoM2USA]
MNLKLDKIRLRNFMSFGNNTMEIDLDQPGSIHVVGVNLDNANQANGIGKTTMLNAISYAFYDKPISKISKDKLINIRNGKSSEMMVQLTFEKGGKSYEITRYRGSKVDVKFMCDGQDLAPNSTDNVNQKILDVIGISYELFSKIVVFSKESVDFLDMPVGSQRDLIEELFNITILSSKAEILKKQIVSTQKQIDILNVEVKAINDANALREKQIADAEKRVLQWEDNKVSKISQLEKDKSAFNGIDFEGQIEAVTLLTTLQQLLRDQTSALASGQRDFERLQKKANDLESENRHLISNTCPYCNQTFSSADKDKKIVDNQALIDQICLEATDIAMKNASISGDIAGIEEQLNEVKTFCQYSSVKEITTLKSHFDSIDSQITQLNSTDNPHLEAYAALLDSPIQENKTEDLDKAVKQLEHMKFLLKLLTDKKSFIRKAIISRTLPFMNKRLQDHVKALELPHDVAFDSDMTCIVHKNGISLDYGNMSAGEKQRANLALAFTFRDVLQNLHTPINAMFMDEVDGGSLDTNGMDCVLRLIKQKSRDDGLTIWVISHRQEVVNRLDKIMTIFKENDFVSNIEWT